MGTREEEQVRGSVVSRTARWTSLLPIAPVAIYVAVGSLLASTGVGLHYDEAIFQTGAIDLISRPGFPEAIPAGMWINAFGRRAKLMVLPYAGVPKDYALALPYTLFGTQPIVSRLLSIALTALAIVGFGRLVAHLISPTAGLIVALVLAVNPALMDMTVFDNGGVVQPILALGLLAFAVDRYLRRRSLGRIFWIGAALGFAVWARLNLLWILVPFMAASLVFLWKTWRPRLDELTALVAGAFLGAAPLLLYEIKSGFGSLRPGQAHQSVLSHLSARLITTGESLIADREHRAIWGGGPPHLWTWLPLVVVALAVLLAPFVVSGAPPVWRLFSRILVMTLLGAAFLTITSSFIIAQHHTVVMVPLFVMSAVVGAAILVNRRPSARWVTAAVLTLYLIVSLSFDAGAITGARTTRGVGLWSDSMSCVAQYLRETESRGTVGALDWGFTTSLYVLNRGTTPIQDFFWGGYHRKTWAKDLLSRHRLLMHSQTYVQFSAPMVVAREVLASLNHRIVAVEFRDKQGRLVSLVAELTQGKGVPVIEIPQDVRTAVARLRSEGCSGVDLVELSSI